MMARTFVLQWHCTHARAWELQWQGSRAPPQEAVHMVLGSSDHDEEPVTSHSEVLGRDEKG